MFVALGLLLITGSYRGHQGSFETMPLAGGGLVVFGLILLVGFYYADIGE